MENSFWAIALSVVISIATNLLSPYIERFFSTLSKSRKEKKESQKAKFNATLQFLLDTPTEEIILRIRYLQIVIISFLTLVLGTSMLLSNNPLYAIFSLVFIALGLYGDTKANRLQKIITKLQDEKKKPFPKHRFVLIDIKNILSQISAHSKLSS